MNDRLATVRRAASLFVPAALLAAGIFAVLVRIQDGAAVEVTEAGEVRAVDQARLAVLAGLANGAGDVRYLADSPLLAAYIASGTSAARDLLAQDFVAFARSHPVYDKLRFIDTTGNELVRVDRSLGVPAEVPETKLQKKAQRPYVAAALKLAPGQVYQSALDLSVEDGAVERPLKPTVRFATPVFDAGGARRGLLVVNSLGAYVIERVRSLNEGRLGQVFMLNGDGYWLLGPSADEEWGFMLPGGSGRSLAAESPSAWEKIRSSGTSGAFYDGGNLYTFARIAAGAAFANGVDPPAATPENEILVVSIRPVGAVSATTAELHRTRWIAAGAIFLMLAILSAVFGRLWTQRKRNEAAVAGLNRDLAERNDELSRVNKELESFSYSVSHDLRAPLRAIDGFSQALVEDAGDKLDADAKGHLDRIRKGAQRMGDLIDDLLKLARVTRTEVAIDKVDLSAMATEIVCGLRDAAPERQAEVAIAAGLVAESDPRLMRVALENLIGNAWKFTARREPAKIEFGHSNTEAGETFFVRDNGAGFEMQYAGKLFNPFQRLHDSTIYPGTGIGLATVQRIIRKHGGKVWADAEPEKGATFYFTLAA
ncbi:MAG TPA: ATP-binding protein [Bauldia sp.]|nr:ATP-binding protein [Bauldia sp.]